MTEHERRIAFLSGEGTLTVAEVRRWAQELSVQTPIAWGGPPPLPAGLTDDEPLMVSVVPAPPDTRGLTGATVIRSAL